MGSAKGFYLGITLSFVTLLGFGTAIFRLMENNIGEIRLLQETYKMSENSLKSNLKVLSERLAETDLNKELLMTHMMVSGKINFDTSYIPEVNLFPGDVALFEPQIGEILTTTLNKLLLLNYKQQLIRKAMKRINYINKMLHEIELNRSIEYKSEVKQEIFESLNAYDAGEYSEEEFTEKMKIHELEIDRKLNEINSLESIYLN